MDNMLDIKKLDEEAVVARPLYKNRIIEFASAIAMAGAGQGQPPDHQQKLVLSIRQPVSAQRLH
jgi:hypothetical protein